MPIYERDRLFCTNDVLGNVIIEYFITLAKNVLLTNDLAELLGTESATVDDALRVLYAKLVAHDAAGDSHEDIRELVAQARSIAEGRSRGVSFADYSALATALNAAAAEDYVVGDNFFVQTADVPDLWVYEVASTSTAYTYTDDATLAAALDAGPVQIGYYLVAKLETGKVDISGEIATHNSSGTAHADIRKLIDGKADGDHTQSVTTGGTGGTSAPAGLHNLISGSGALAASGLATNDLVGIGDVSAATGKKITLADLASFLASSLGVGADPTYKLCSVILEESQTWTAPANLVGGKVNLIIVGGGGGGGGGNGGGAGGGGSGAGITFTETAVTPGSSYSVVIGAGGTGGAGTAGGTGGTSKFGSLSAVGGNGGGAGTAYAGGNGANAPASGGGGGGGGAAGDYAGDGSSVAHAGNGGNGGMYGGGGGGGCAQGTSATNYGGKSGSGGNGGTYGGGGGAGGFHAYAENKIGTGGKGGTYGGDGGGFEWNGSNYVPSTIDGGNGTVYTGDPYITRDLVIDEADFEAIGRSGGGGYGGNGGPGGGASNGSSNVGGGGGGGFCGSGRQGIEVGSGYSGCGGGGGGFGTFTGNNGSGGCGFFNWGCGGTGLKSTGDDGDPGVVVITYYTKGVV